MILQISKRCKHLVVQISRKEIVNLHEMWHSLQRSGTIALFGNDAFIHSQNSQKVETDIVIFNGNVLGHVGHAWCKKGTSSKKINCSLLICHMQIKSIDFRTMDLWKCITFILIHTVYMDNQIWLNY